MSTVLKRVKRKAGETNFSAHFSPRDYLKEYFSAWDIEDEFTMSFLHRIYEGLEPQETMVEIGGGPIIHQLISARRKVESIIFAEYLARNRFEVKTWKQNHKAAFDWDPYFEYIARLEKTDEPVADMKRSLRQKIRAIIPCDILRPPVLPAIPDSQFDLVSVHFCPESITSDESEFVAGMSRIVSLAKPNGLFVMSFLKESEIYAVGSKNFSAYPLTEKKLLETLSALDCQPLHLEHGPANPQFEYPGTMSLLAQRKPIISRVQR